MNEEIIRTWSLGVLLSQDFKLLGSQNGPPLFFALLNRKRVAVAHVVVTPRTTPVGSRGCDRTKKNNSKCAVVVAISTRRIEFDG